MFSESELLPISALQHLLFCERQAALIHIERVWVENRFTVEGRQLHDKAHGKDAGPRGGGLDDTRRSVDGSVVRTTRGMALRSLTLGLFGVADVVEFHTPADAAGGNTPVGSDAVTVDSAEVWMAEMANQADGGGSEGTPQEERVRTDDPSTDDRSLTVAARMGMHRSGHTPGADAQGAACVENNAGGFPSPTARRAPPVPFPVEYKRGRPKAHDADRVQLCAQSLCLEEMLGTAVPRGALFYGRTRRREVVNIDDALRGKTKDAANRLHELIRSGVTPLARKEPKCRHCSLFDVCMPQAIGARRSVAQYMRRAMADTDAFIESCGGTATDIATGGEEP